MRLHRCGTDLVGILSARHDRSNAIDKFILIGDYKQLPAIAQQEEEEARVDDPLLQSIGLNDCRNSLFERLYKQSKEDFESILHKQGRMHPAISEFLTNILLCEQLEASPVATPRGTPLHLLMRQRTVLNSSR